MKRHLKSAFFILILSFVSVSAYAEQDTRFQMFFRTGIIEGSYRGTFSDDFSVTLAFDIGTEYFVTPDSSAIVRFIQGLDADSVPYYTYAGGGMKYYFWGRSHKVTQEENDIIFSSRPKIRGYLGTEFGIAQVIVKSFGQILQSVANMAEVGLNVGAIYQVSEHIGLEAHVGGTLGYGISSTNANGHTLRALGGITYYF